MPPCIYCKKVIYAGKGKLGCKSKTKAKRVDRLAGSAACFGDCDGLVLRVWGNA